ncbi:alpha/beta fold hydrolase [Comamonas thiooxydans]|uniref:alpha/beta fold hydrolase n=1 Tax=Comamonas thiooxydans TaxID=363952 RepID=UPI0001BB1644|nr:alpha/beta hydrolase [Comamonas thiooxydans]ACY31971.1 alpha/beta hydrolase fold protein [Comamonas thiooxydans]MDO1473994.1 alpha/beta hydrolase [Comamonas thiooxydans]
MLKPAMPNNCASAAIVPASCYANCAGYEIHYLDWKPQGPTKATVIAWHGLARTGRDMDALAQFLAVQGYRVICPDTLGRGLSQWSRNPREEYQLRFYARLARELMDALALQQVHWVGTSMGGAIGTVCASGLFEPDLRQRILTLTLNDNAPELAEAALARIKSYAGRPPMFDTVAELEGFFRAAYKPYGWLSDFEWRKLTETSTRRCDDGRVTPHYDPRMIEQFTEHDNDYLLWDHYDALQLPVLLLRGEESDLVLKPVAEQMQQRGPGARGLLTWLEVPDCGHAPALNVSAHFEAVLSHLHQA